MAPIHNHCDPVVIAEVDLLSGFPVAPIQQAVRCGEPHLLRFGVIPQLDKYRNAVGAVHRSQLFEWLGEPIGTS
jgi:hypothetical protein